MAVKRGAPVAFSFGMTSPRRRLVVASNRGPVEWSAGSRGQLEPHRAPGGLTTILRGALSDDASWVAAAISEGDRRAASLRPRTRVALTGGQVELRMLTIPPPLFAGYYEQIANHTLWFLHHHLFDIQREPRFDAAFAGAWRAYEMVNDQFAAACAEEAATADEALVVDYHLTLVPARLRELRPGLRITHLTACPWADPAVFRILPESVARRIVDGMLGADLVAFLAGRWASAFVACCADLGYDADARFRTVRAGDGRMVRVDAFPIGVDGRELRAQLEEPACVQARRELDGLRAGRHLLVRIDRMDPSKNILRGMEAYEHFLEANAWARGSVVHYVLAYQTRGGIADYRSYGAAALERAAAVNRRFGRDGWQPVHLETVSDIPRALAAMELADVVVVNTLRDGMNLIAKEAIVVGRRDPVLILSREAGAAHDLGDGAMLVNPFDVLELAAAMDTALHLSPAERRRRSAMLAGPAEALPPKEWLARLRSTS